MAKKVTLTITVNDDKAPNDLGIRIIAKRDNNVIGYGNLTANELEKLSIVFNTLVLHKEDNMNKEEIRRAKHILRKGTINDDFHKDIDRYYLDFKVYKNGLEQAMKDTFSEFPLYVQRIAYITIGYAKCGKKMPYNLSPCDSKKQLTSFEDYAIKYFVKRFLTESKDGAFSEPPFDADGYFIRHHGHIVSHIGSLRKQDLFFHELIGRGIPFITFPVHNDVFFDSIVWNNAEKIICEYDLFDEEAISDDYTLLHWVSRVDKDNDVILINYWKRNGLYRQ